jgi:single-strand DNA-binding protein
MKDINLIVLLGRLTKDPELKQIGDKHLLKFTIANNSKIGESEKVNYVDVNLWGNYGISLNQYLNKGTQVIVKGRIEQSRWLDSAGNNKSKLEIIAESVQMVGNKTNN